MKAKYYIKGINIVTLLLALTLVSGCKKMISIAAPVTSINGANVYANNTTAAAVLTGIYANLSSIGLSAAPTLKSIPYWTGLSSDELTLFDQTRELDKAYFTNTLETAVTNNFTFWNAIYPIIFTANSAIEGISNTTTLTPSVKEQLIGEAKFMRAFCYFYLVNLYGDVPLALSTDYSVNRLLSRKPKADVYQQMVADLKDAQLLLKTQYLNGDVLTNSTDRVRPNKSVATALLARVYLYMKDYNNADLQATEVINNNSIYSLVPLDNVFLIGSREAIWQLYSVGIGNSANTAEGRLLILPSGGPNGVNFVYLSDHIAKEFQSGDQRGTHWVKEVTSGGRTYAYAYKYKVGDVSAAPQEYSMVLRLAEQYLIRAEARIQQDKIAEGINDINTIRRRCTDTTAPIADQLPQLPVTLAKMDALKAVEYERKFELFTEWGHRWLDLKRMVGFSDPNKSRADEVLPSIKGVTWQSTDQLYPISQMEINLNPSLIGHQNPGYN